MCAGLLPLLVACSFDGSGIATAEDGGGGEADAAAGADAELPALDGALEIDGAPPLILRFNAGGPEHQGTDYPGTWAADSGRCDAFTWDEFGDVSGTVDDTLFEYYRYSSLGGSIQCQLGQDLQPVFFGSGCPGEGGEGDRVFSIDIEGATLESGIDTVSEGGCCHPDADTPGEPFSRTFTVTVSDGALDLTFRASGDQTRSMVSAIQLKSVTP